MGLPVPHRSNEPARPRHRAPDALVDFHTGDENGTREDGQCFKGAYVRQNLGMRTKSSGIETCRDEGGYRSILGHGCIKDALDAGHGEELRALGLNEAQLRLLFPCQSADLNSCAKGRGQTPKLLKALLRVVNVK